MVIPILGLKEQYNSLKTEISSAVNAVMEGTHFIMGENVQLLERELAAFCHVKHGIGVANGSDALHLALMAVDTKPGDEVITTPFTFFATAGSVARLGATPVFVDIDPVTYNIDQDQIGEKVSARTKCIIPVDLYGQPYDVAAVSAIANRHDLVIIEDAAQAIGAEYQGRRACSYGHLACTSFFPTKNLGGYGDGGMVFSDDDDLAERVRVLRVHGSKPKYYHHVLGYNSRLDELQAAILRVKLRYLEEWTDKRIERAQKYDELFKSNGLAEVIGLPTTVAGRKHVFHQYTIRVPQRDQLQQYLADQGIGTAVYYPLPLHLQPVFAYLGYGQGAFPVAEQACSEVLSLPMFPELTEEQQGYVVSSVKEFYNKHLLKRRSR